MIPVPTVAALDRGKGIQAPGPAIREHGATMSHGSDRDGTERKENPDRSQDRTETRVPSRWLETLNTFLERAYLEADRATGC